MLLRQGGADLGERLPVVGPLGEAGVEGLGDPQGETIGLNRLAGLPEELPLQSPERQEVPDVLAPEVGHRGEVGGELLGYLQGPAGELLRLRPPPFLLEEAREVELRQDEAFAVTGWSGNSAARPSRVR